MKKKFSPEIERNAVLAHYCGVSPEYMVHQWGVSHSTALNLSRIRPSEWRDPLVDFYRGEGTFSNAAHIYLVFNNQDDLDERCLIDTGRDIDVYKAVENDIVKPRLSGFGLVSRLDAEKNSIRALICRVLRDGYDSAESHRAKLDYFNDIFGHVDLLFGKINCGHQLAYREDESRAKVDLLNDALDRVLATITDRERKVIKLRYGIGEGEASTIEDVGKLFRITRERVRQIEAKAFRKLQYPSRTRLLEGALSE